MDKTEIENVFLSIMRKEKEVSAGVAAIRTLLKFLEHDKSETLQELDANLKTAIDVMRNMDFPVTAVASGSELFLRFITFATLDFKPFIECKKIMLHRGEVFLKKLMEARGKVAKLGAGFITDRSRVLTHSKSRVVLQTMKEAVKANKRFEVYITKSSPDSSGDDMAQDLEKLNIPCTVILDSAVAYVMEQVDMVMVGAEGVVESGGIINKVGSFTMAVCAREMKKPFYVLTESFKFARLYPLNQRDLPDEFKTMEGSAELVDVKQLDEDTHKEICFELIKVEPYLMDDTEEETVLIRPNDIKVEIEESEFSENEEVNENNLSKEMNCMSDKEEMSCDWNESAVKKTDHLAMFPVIQSEIKHECTNKGNTSTREYASPCTSTINDPTTTEKPAKLIQDNEEYFNEEIKHEEVHFELIKEETVVINDVIVDDNGLECSENEGLHEINQTTDNDSMVNEDKVPHGCAMQVDGSANIQPNRKKSNYQSVKEFRERQRVAKENFRQQFLSQSAIQVEGSANIQPNRKKSNYQSVKEFRERQRVAKENFRQQFLSQRKETAVNEPDPLALSLVAQNNKNTLSSSEALIDASPSTSIGNVIQKCGSGLTTFDNHQEQRKSCSPDKLKIHAKPSSNDGVFICNKCFYSTSKKSMLRKHHLHKHNTKKSYQCKQCNYSSDRAYCLKIHARVHSGEKPYRCSMCDYSATQSSSLKTHMKVHSREKPYKCSTCDYSSAEYCKVTRHMKIHTGEKPHKCEQCNYSAAQPDSLKKHMRIHTGEKPHKCEQCNYTATQSSSIKVHVRAVHSGEKPYKCLKCDYSAYSLSKLKRHMRVHSAEKPL